MPIDPGLSRWQTDDRRSGSSTPNDPDRVRPATPGRDERRCSLDGNIGSRSLVEEVTRRDDRHTQIDRRAAWGHSSRICRRRSHPATGDSTRHDGADLTKTRRARLSITRHRLHRISAHEMPPSATRPLFEKWFPAPLPFPPRPGGGAPLPHRHWPSHPARRVHPPPYGRPSPARGTLVLRLGACRCHAAGSGTVSIRLPNHRSAMAMEFGQMRSGRVSSLQPAETSTRAWAIIRMIAVEVARDRKYWSGLCASR